MQLKRVQHLQELLADNARKDGEKRTGENGRIASRENVAGNDGKTGPEEIRGVNIGKTINFWENTIINNY